MVIKKNSLQYFILDESELIDWEKGSDSTDRCDESEKDDSSLEISDSDSCTNLNSLPVKEENDELCKVRHCFKFKEKKKSFYYNYGVYSYLISFNLEECEAFAYLISPEEILYTRISGHFL